MQGLKLRGKGIALYGRFSPRVREAFAAAIAQRGGTVARDLTRRSDALVVGARAFPLIAGGRLGARIRAARARGAPVYAEQVFAERLGDREETPPTLPLASVRDAPHDAETLGILAAFDVIRLADGAVRFADAPALKSAAELLAAGRTMEETVRTLTDMRAAPLGRRRLVVSPNGPALQWADGLTRLDGQGLLPLEEDSATLDDLFEEAAEAELAGDLAEAARLYDAAARADRKDAIAPYNLGVARLGEGRPGEAALAFRQALARDPLFVEARYNLAAAAEALGKEEIAREELLSALKIEPAYADARFNLAQLELKRGDVDAAKNEFERYLAADPPPDWAEKARRAILYCTAAMGARQSGV